MCIAVVHAQLALSRLHISVVKTPLIWQITIISSLSAKRLTSTMQITAYHRHLVVSLQLPKRSLSLFHIVRDKPCFWLPGLRSYHQLITAYGYALFGDSPAQLLGFGSLRFDGFELYDGPIFGAPAAFWFGVDLRPEGTFGILVQITKECLRPKSCCTLAR